MNLWMAFKIPLFWSTILFFCMMLFTYGQKRKKYFHLRIILSIVVTIVLQTIICYLTYSVSSYLPRFVSALIMTVFFFIEVGLCAAILLVSFKINVKEAIFFVVSAYSLEHFSNAIRSIFGYALTYNGLVIPQTIENIVLNIALKAIICFIIYFFFIRKYLNKFQLQDMIDNRVLVISSINLVICLVLSVFKTYTINGEPTSSFTTSVICNIYALFGCFLCLYLQFAYFVEMKLKNENKALDILFKEQNRANQLSKENIDLINIKFHDLKKQLRRLEENKVFKGDEIEVKNIKEVLATYDAFVKTGNGAIDTVLMNSYLTSVNKKIDFTYFVDGESLNFIDSMDVVSLFDNLLDNAFESVKEEIIENKVIHLQVSKEKQMVIIHCRNYCSKKPKFVQGFPITSSDTKYHGYGMKSIKRIVSKYDGNIKCSWKDEFFNVNIIFPIMKDN